MKNLDLPESGQSEMDQEPSDRKHNLYTRQKTESMHQQYNTQQQFTQSESEEVQWQIEQERLEKDRRIRDFEERQKENQRKKQEKLDKLAAQSEPNYTFKPNINKRRSPDRSKDLSTQSPEMLNPAPGAHAGDRLYKQGIERIGRMNQHQFQADQQQQLY